MTLRLNSALKMQVFWAWSSLRMPGLHRAPHGLQGLGPQPGVDLRRQELVRGHAQQGQPQPVIALRQPAQVPGRIMPFEVLTGRRSSPGPLPSGHAPSATARPAGRWRRSQATASMVGAGPLMVMLTLVVGRAGRSRSRASSHRPRCRSRRRCCPPCRRCRGGRGGPRRRRLPDSIRFRWASSGS